MNKTFVFIGYDEREQEAYDVCVKSLCHNSDNIVIIPLNHRYLRQTGLFSREWTIDSKGQYIDNKDGKPFSTQFSHSRFLVPKIYKSLGLVKNPYCVFIDCDFVFEDSIDNLINEVESVGDKPVYVVKNNFTFSKYSKMDGVDQSNYEKKLWSSLMVFNVFHSENKILTEGDIVNEEDGRYFHQFQWLSSDDEIGEISPRWNFIPEKTNPKYINKLGAVHFTEGGPWFPDKKYCELSDVYYKYQEML